MERLSEEFRPGSHLHKANSNLLLIRDLSVEFPGPEGSIRAVDGVDLKTTQGLLQGKEVVKMELDWATVWHQKYEECFWTVKLLTKDDMIARLGQMLVQGCGDLCGKSAIPSGMTKDDAMYVATA